VAGMSGWKIDPDQVGAALTSARAGITELQSAEQAARTAVDSASAVTGPETAATLGVLLQNPLLSQIGLINEKVTHAIDQTHTALAAYVDGDDEMASAYKDGVDQ